LQLQAKIRAALPPDCLHLSSRECTPVTGNRYVYHFARVLAEIQRQKGATWRQIEVRELEPDTRRRLANVAFDYHFAPLLADFTRSGWPPWWKVAPEQGRLVLKGEVGPGMHPFLEFQVQRPDGNIDSWGWYVGTSSLDE
jgi:hypothetical protein